jgi:hypothetical protein
VVNPIIRIALLLAFLPGASLTAQEKSAETTANVPALQEFHTVIFSLWHTAWPKKDVDMMTKLLPDIEKGAAAVRAAALPGILRDRKPEWESGVQKLDEAVTAYRVAVKAKENQRLLAAAEQLHMRYEGLVRVIRPPFKEIEAFHSVLYMLYHKYWPENNLPRIRESAKALTEKMAALDTAALPKRLESKKTAFLTARVKLGNAVRGLQEMVGTTYDAPAPGDLKAAITKLHDCYQQLEKVFD